jgi:type I restriction enzyme S subunit
MSIIHTIEEIDATWNENLNKKTMKLKKYRIDDIADLNRSCISKIDTISDIEYLDTSNITENVIFDTYMLNIDNAPSRAQRKVSDKTILYSSTTKTLWNP